MKRLVKIISIMLIILCITGTCFASIVEPEEITVNRDDEATTIHIFLKLAANFVEALLMFAGIICLIVFINATMKMLKIQEAIKKEDNKETIESLSNDRRILQERVRLFVFLSIAFFIAGGMLNIVVGFRM